MGEERRCIQGFVGKPEEKRSRHRLEDYIKINLEERGWGWTGLIWHRIGTSGGIM
jgi:hypothetical protein